MPDTRRLTSPEGFFNFSLPQEPFVCGLNLTTECTSGFTSGTQCSNNYNKTGYKDCSGSQGDLTLKCYIEPDITSIQACFHDFVSLPSSECVDSDMSAYISNGNIFLLAECLLTNYQYLTDSCKVAVQNEMILDNSTFTCSRLCTFSYANPFVFCPLRPDCLTNLTLINATEILLDPMISNYTNATIASIEAELALMSLIDCDECSNNTIIDCSPYIYNSSCLSLYDPSYNASIDNLVDLVYKNDSVGFIVDNSFWEPTPACPSVYTGATCYNTEFVECIESSLVINSCCKKLLNSDARCPTRHPTLSPTLTPSFGPSFSPSFGPTDSPTKPPTQNPTASFAEKTYTPTAVFSSSSPFAIPTPYPTQEDNKKESSFTPVFIATILGMTLVVLVVCALGTIYLFSNGDEVYEIVEQEMI